MVASSSSKVLGTSRDTTRSVTAKAKTASENPSIRETSSPRQRKASSPPCLRVNPSRTTVHSPPLGFSRTPPGSGTMIEERPSGAQDRIMTGDDLIAHDKDVETPEGRRTSCSPMILLLLI